MFELINSKTKRFNDIKHYDETMVERIIYNVKFLDWSCEHIFQRIILHSLSFKFEVIEVQPDHDSLNKLSKFVLQIITDSTSFKQKLFISVFHFRRYQLIYLIV